MKQKFNPQDWLPKNDADQPQPSNNQPSNNQPSRHQPSNNQPSIQPSNVSDDIALIVSRIEAFHTDITGTYADWLNLGFALADELGEGGRDYFHRISRFHPKYSHTDCNKQYDQCMKSKGHGITIKTLFHLAKQGGIDVGGAAVFNRINNKGQEMEQNAVKNRRSLPATPSPDLPTFSDSVYAALPDFLQKVINLCDSREEKDIMLLGTIVTISSCLPKVYGYYDRRRVHPNLFLFITAQASAGKGSLVQCKRLVNPIHWEHRKETHAMKAQYEIDMREYNLQKGKDLSLEKPAKPPEKMLFIPANNSTTGVFQLLSDNDGKGLIFETEGDTLAQAFKSDYGNYSDGFRKAFHHENISYYRRTDREYVEIDNPCLSTVLSSTPKQVATLIPNAENGLLSRFIFYHMNIRPVWKNVFPKENNNAMELEFDKLGQEFFPLYKALRENPAIEFCMTDEQHDQFHAFFTQIQDKYLMLQGMDYMATIRRLGLIAFRMAMAFTMLRILETGDFSQKQVCPDTDFQTVLSMVKILVKHSSHVFSELQEDIKPAKPKDRKEQFLDMLPKKFNRQIYLDLAKNLSIHLRTAETYITNFCDKGYIFREQKDTYINLMLTKDEGEKGENTV
ncbi:MAG TPA: DUF3987 domain-containing protein [Prolixibacteraceae bacterium]|jgi:hypothetical protein